MGQDGKTRSRIEFQTGKQIVGEKVRSGGVTLDECESDRV